ncbi:class II lanthipeptide, LchA2/BrtA2 family [Streptomyces sp. NPDC007100]|uniref:class II lanthipeptide, LchA2/BrtA2 family n=1 Tax=Streptomyces sp. NPDC007100 TaxID=3155602 RepID=UPI0033F48191
MEQQDFLGAYDELELIELSEQEWHGGTGPVCVAASVAASAAFCPTTKCTSKC